MPNIHLSWIAVKGRPKDDMLSALGLVEAPAEPRRLRWALAERDGWLILLVEDFGYPTPARLAELSAGGTALACSIDERIMYSVARGYQNGQAVWSVDHNGGEEGPYHLSIAGAPPPELAEVRARLTADQDREETKGAEVDYLYEVPAELSLVLCGYRFDPEKEGPAFTALEPAKTGKGSGFLGWLFGKKG